ncbi:transposable element Tc1 transposase [Trichonephila clavipes]|uniref:Transposable element Tc1 transposase n=1 Tax=Trichonephila clavipes TaxID=2585209 RepID=A0A8X6RN64_TRICX|nr:transposable element Tc1 transposase [Trichonephila clavipes]
MKIEKRSHQHIAWQADWQQVIFSDESRTTLRDHDGRIRVTRYAGERCLPECVLERQSGLTPGDSYHRQSNLLEDNFNSNIYVREMPQPEVVPFLQGFSYLSVE